MNHSFPHLTRKKNQHSDFNFDCNANDMNHNGTINASEKTSNAGRIIKKEMKQICKIVKGIQGTCSSMDHSTQSRMGGKKSTL
jgi:hypothetical protein